MKKTKFTLLLAACALLLIPICSFKSTDSSEKFALRLYVIGVSKNATEVPTIYMESRGKRTKLKELHKISPTNPGPTYTKNTTEVVELIMSMRVMGFKLKAHKEVVRDNPNESGIVFYFKKK